MNLYTLSTDDGSYNSFQRKDVIDSFTSVIWVERYYAPGEFNLVIEATEENINKLAEENYLALSGTKEVMIIDTQEIVDGFLTVTGYSLLGFMNERVIWTDDIIELRNKVKMVVGKKPGELLAYIADLAAITPTRSYDALAGLSLGSIDLSGSVIPQFPLQFSPALESLQSVAETYGFGISLYLDSVHPGVLPLPGYDLKFKVYTGTDRSDTIKFSPTLNSLTNVKELKSIRGYKTHALALAPNAVVESSDFFMLTVPAIPDTDFDPDFNRRVMLIFMDDLTLESIGAVDPLSPTSPEIALMYSTMYERAINVLANNNYIKLVDGEVVSGTGFKFGTDYFLGDIVELQGYSGITQNARITEYIRSQDSTGERAYPTVSVID